MAGKAQASLTMNWFPRSPGSCFSENNRLSVNLKMSFLNSSPLPMKGDGSSGVSESEVEQASYSDKLTGKGRTF